MPMRVHKRWYLLLITGLALCAAVPGQAQIDLNTLLSATPQGSTTNYRFAEPSELTIVVSLLGPVARPGRYEISRSIDLPNLLSLAGGTREGADLGDIRVMRTVKNGERLERKEIRVDLEEELSDMKEMLQLNQGDFVVVGESTWMTLRDALSVLTTAAVITTTIVYLYDVSQR